MGGLNGEGQKEGSNTQNSRRRWEGVREIMEGQQQTTQRSRKGVLYQGSRV